MMRTKSSQLCARSESSVSARKRSPLKTGTPTPRRGRAFVIRLLHQDLRPVERFRVAVGRGAFDPAEPQQPAEGLGIEPKTVPLAPECAHEAIHLAVHLCP